MALQICHMTTVTCNKQRGGGGGGERPGSSSNPIYCIYFVEMDNLFICRSFFQASTNLTIQGHFVRPMKVCALCIDQSGTYMYEIFSQHRSSVKMFH